MTTSKGLTSIDASIASEAVVAVVIPTMATQERFASLRRAVDSVRHSTIRPVCIIVVVNGDVFDPEVCAWLQTQREVQFEQIAAASLPAAVLRGRELIHAPFFGFLDDDDEYLPGGLDRKLEALDARPEAALVIANGHLHRSGADAVAIPHLARVPLDPLATMFESAWLNSCNALFRTASVGTEFFRDYHAKVEWTWLAFKIASEGIPLATVDLPTFRVHDTPGSLSKSEHYFRAYVSLYQRMMQRTGRSDIRQILRSRLSSAWHQISVLALGNGRRGQAWYAHLRSMANPGGLRYLTYTRHLMRP